MHGGFNPMKKIINSLYVLVLRISFQRYNFAVLRHMAVEATLLARKVQTFIFNMKSLISKP